MSNGFIAQKFYAIPWAFLYLSMIFCCNNPQVTYFNFAWTIGAKNIIYLLVVPRPPNEGLM